MKKGAAKTDYNNIILSLKEKMYIGGKGLVLLGIISYLFYHSVIAYIVLLPAMFLFIKNGKKKLTVQKKRNLQREFKEGITLLLSGLEAGYSIENAFADASAELRRMYQRETDIEKEFRLICKGVKLNEPIEALLLDFADRSGLEDIKNFAEVFAIAKRRGGDLITILKSSINTIQEKIEVKQEIDTLISGKKFEQKIMSVVPMGILIYVHLTSPEFLESIYKNIAGIFIMSCCLAVYALSVYIGEKIIEVEV